MQDGLKRVTCDPDCGFMVQSHDEAEVIRVAKTHAKEIHKLEETDESVKAMMESV